MYAFYHQYQWLRQININMAHRGAEIPLSVWGIPFFHSPSPQLFQSPPPHQFFQPPSFLVFCGFQLLSKMHVYNPTKDHDETWAWVTRSWEGFTGPARENTGLVENFFWAPFFSNQFQAIFITQINLSKYLKWHLEMRRKDFFILWIMSKSNESSENREYIIARAKRGRKFLAKVWKNWNFDFNKWCFRSFFTFF